MRREKEELERPLSDSRLGSMALLESRVEGFSVWWFSFWTAFCFLEFSGRGVYCYGHVGDNLDALFYLVDRAHYSAGFGV